MLTLNSLPLIGQILLLSCSGFSLDAANNLPLENSSQDVEVKSRSVSGSEQISRIPSKSESGIVHLDGDYHHETFCPSRKYSTPWAHRRIVFSLNKSWEGVNSNDFLHWVYHFNYTSSNSGCSGSLWHWTNHDSSGTIETKSFKVDDEYYEPADADIISGEITAILHGIFNNGVELQLWVQWTEHLDPDKARIQSDVAARVLHPLALQQDDLWHWWIGEAKTW